MTITLAQARTIVDAALAHGVEQGFKPMTAAVLDPGGALVMLARADDSGFLRPDLAIAKASGVLSLGMTSRAIANRVAQNPEFLVTMAALTGGKFVAMAGGVFVHDEAGTLLGAVGVTGDLATNDEAAAVAGVRAAGLVPVTGEES